MPTLRDFHGPNAAYILDLFEQYQTDPSSVDAATRAYFADWSPPGDVLPVAPAAVDTGVNANAVMGAVHLARSIRKYGHLAAQLDPLGSDPPGDPALDPAYHNISEDFNVIRVGVPIAAVRT